MLTRRCLWLALTIGALRLSAEPAELHIAVDRDNSLATGCRIITNLGNVDGIDAILTTTYDGGVVTSLKTQTCLTPGTVDFTAPIVEPGGWAVGANSEGTLIVETRFPVSALPGGLRPDMRLAFIGVSGASLETVLHDAAGGPILFPHPPGRRRSLDPGGARVITLDGRDADWRGVELLVSGLASTGGASLRLLGVRAWATARSLDFVFSIQSNANSPTANDDGWTVLRGGTLHVSAPGVLANDSDPFHRALTASLVSRPSHGTLIFGTDGSFTYAQDGSRTLADAFTYQAFASSASSNVATVTITILPDPPPIAADDHYPLLEGGTLVVPGPFGASLFANDGEPEASGLTAVINEQPLHGTLTLGAGGSFTYAHDGSETTSDLFRYTVSDGIRTSAPATVTLGIAPMDDAPVNTAPAAQSLVEDGVLTFFTTGGNGITVSDADAGLHAIQVTLSATNGTLTLVAAPGASISGNGTASVTVQGLLPFVNAAMNGMQYTPTPHYVGPAQLTILSNDLGNSGAGGPQSATSNVAITVNSARRRAIL